MSELEKYLQSYFGVTAADLAQITTFFRLTTLSKGGYFVKAGRPCNQLAFLQSGLIREYVHAGSKEITKWISASGYFVVDLAGFLFQKPARWNIQALTDCELFTIDQQDYKRIGEVVPRWPELEKLFIAKCFTVLEDRVVMHLSMSAEERYQQLFQFNQSLFNLVPLQYLASMLGMTPETLSRLRKKSAG